MSHWFDSQGRFEEALGRMQKAIELDPLAELFRVDYGFELGFIGRRPEALAQFKQVFELNPGNPFALYGVANVYAAMGDKKAAMTEVDKIGEMANTPLMLGSVGALNARLGRSEPVRKALAEFDRASRNAFLPSMGAAAAAFALGENDRGFVYLQQALTERSSGFTYMLRTADFDGVRNDPRFAAIMRRVGLPDPAWRAQ